MTFRYVALFPYMHRIRLHKYHNVIQNIAKYNTPQLFNLIRTKYQRWARIKTE